MLQPFTLLSPNTIVQALEMLWQHEDAKLLAGGTDVFVDMHRGTSYRILIDLKGIGKLHAAEFDEQTGMRIGALVTMRELMRSEVIQKYYPALIDGLKLVGSVQVRSRATLAGNICNASPAADSAGPLLLYDAVVHIRSKNDERTVPIEDFFTAPKKNCLKKGEMVTHICLAPPVQNAGSGYIKLTKRGAMEIGIMGAGARLATDDAGLCTLARITMSAVNPTPVRVTQAEALLLGKELCRDHLQQAVACAYNLAAPSTWRNSEEWSRDMVRVYVPLAMEKALKRKGKGEF